MAALQIPCFSKFHVLRLQYDIEQQWGKRDTIRLLESGWKSKVTSAEEACMTAALESRTCIKIEDQRE